MHFDLITHCSHYSFSLLKAKAKITQLQEQHRQMKDAITTCDAAISSDDAVLVSDATLNLEPEFRDPEYNRVAMVNGGSPVEHVSINSICYRPHGKGSTEVRITQNKGKESENSYQKLMRFLVRVLTFLSLIL